MTRRRPARLAATRRAGSAALAGVVVATAVAAIDVTAAAAGTWSRTTTVVGTVELLQGDDFDHGRSTKRHVLRVGRRTYALDVRGTPAPRPGSHVRVSGRRRGSTLTVDARHGGVVRPTAAWRSGGRSRARLASVATPGPLTVAVLRVAFAGDPTEPVAEDQARTVTFTGPDSVSAWLADQTAGAVTLRGALRGDGDVLGPYTVARGVGCEPYSWADAAASAATAAGVDLDAYDHVVHALPETTACAWSGLAQVPGDTSWINGPTAFGLRVVAHELGHNLGAHHASTVRCTDHLGAQVPLSTSCRVVSEYGDALDIMGDADRRHFQAETKHRLGWAGDAAVRTVTEAGSYTVAPSARPAGGAVRVLRIARGAQPPLCLDVRGPSDSLFDVFDPGDPAVTGVTARLCPRWGRTRLLDTTPATGSFGDAPLAPGRSLTDPGYGFTVTTESVTPFGATVTVAFHGDLQAPAAPRRPTAIVEGTSAVRLSWPAAADNVGVALYVVRRDGVALGSTTARAFRDTAPQPRAVYTVEALDAAGHVGPPSPGVAVELPAAPRPAAPPPSAVAPPPAAPVAVPVPSGPRRDEQPPTAPAQVSLEAAGLTAVSLRWTPAGDDRRVAGYAVFRGPTRVRDVVGTTFLDTGLRPATTYAYSVRAYDAAGNLGPPTQLTATTRRWNGTLTVSHATLRPLRRGAALRLTVHTAETPPVPVRCSWRIGTGPWRACRLDRSGTTTLHSVVATRRRATVSVRVTGAATGAFTTQRVVRP